MARPANPITTAIALSLVCGMVGYGIWRADSLSIAIGIIVGSIILPDVFRLIARVLERLRRS